MVEPVVLGFNGACVGISFCDFCKLLTCYSCFLPRLKQAIPKRSKSEHWRAMQLLIPLFRFLSLQVSVMLDIESLYRSKHGDW